MRNFHNVVPQSSTIHWFADKEMSLSTYLTVLAAFNRVFENPEDRPFRSLTPSEQRVISSFLRYARSCRNRKSDYRDDHPGSFLYCNINTGQSLVFITWYGYGDFAGGSSNLV